MIKIFIWEYHDYIKRNDRDDNSQLVKNTEELVPIINAYNSEKVDYKLINL